MPCNLSINPGTDSEFIGPAGATSRILVRVEDGQPPAAVKVIRASYAGRDITAAMTFDIQPEIKFLRLFVEATSRIWVQVCECCETDCETVKVLRRFKADPAGVDRAFRILGE